MAVGVRTEDLRKVYHSAPPLAAGGIVMRSDAKGAKQPKTEIKALDGVSLEIHPGEIFGLLGPNGAGKSTTVGVLTTRVRPTSGQAWIGEHDVWRRPASRKIQANRSRQSNGPRVFRWNDAAAFDCPRHDARPAGSVP